MNDLEDIGLCPDCGTPIFYGKRHQNNWCTVNLLVQIRDLLKQLVGGPKADE